MLGRVVINQSVAVVVLPAAGENFWEGEIEQTKLNLDYSLDPSNQFISYRNANDSCCTQCKSFQSPGKKNE